MNWRAITVLAAIALPVAIWAQDKGDALLQKVQQEEARRIAVVKKITPTVVAVFSRGGKGGGSGVLFSFDGKPSAEGYALTNFHVVAPAGPIMKCGLADGNLYDAVLVGWDKVGDVALIKLFPKEKGQKFPTAKLGDSDTVREGDWSIAAGNPFLLATDFQPTVTFGLVSGIHRYQYPAGTFLEYTDCIQIDTSINPGNSGGPLYNMQGEVIGINGRGSFDKRGRVNSGVGYAISINQIKNFLGHLKAGLDCDHASLGAIVTTQTDSGALPRLVVTDILEDCDAFRRGLDLDDELVSFDGKLLTSVNQYLNIIGTYPRGWRVPIEYRRDGKTHEILVRLMGKVRRTLKEDPKRPAPGRPGRPVLPIGNSPVAKYYVKKPGFANYYFNKFEKQRVAKGFARHGDFSALAGDWQMTGDVRFKRLRSKKSLKVMIDNDGGAGGKPLIKMYVDTYDYRLEPLKKEQPSAAMRLPSGSGGFLAAMYLYRFLLTKGFDGFVESTHGGIGPIYPPLPSGKKVTSWVSRKQMAEIIETELGRFFTTWYFSPDDQKLLAFEVRIDEKNSDPCEVYLSDYRPVNGRLLPFRIQVRYGDSLYGTIEVRSYDFQKAS